MFFKKAAVFISIQIAILLVFGSIQANADYRGGHRYYDTRHHHNRYYHARGLYVRALPHGYRVYKHGGARFFYHGGVWYRPWGPRFVVVTPPFGMIVPFLPPYYATVWVGSVPYYYANNVYYTPAPGGYMVIEPPQGEPASVAPGSEQVYIYPRQGQTEQQQGNDRYECHRWAVGQTGYDPTQPPGGTADPRKRAEYDRALGACLDGKGYTVK